MYCAVLTFATPHWPTIGTFTVTGVVDGTTGTPFQGKWFFIHGGSIFALDSIMYQALDFFHANAQADARGADDLTLAAGGTVAERGQGFRVLSGAGGHGYSILEFESTTLFGGIVHQAGYISASRVGEFDYTIDLNTPDGGGGGVDRDPGIVMVTVLGGADLSVEFPSGPALLANGTYPCAARPAAFFNFTSSSAGLHGTSHPTGAGGGIVGWGWEARDSGRGTATYGINGQFGGPPSPQPNSGVVCTDRLAAQIDGVTGALDAASPVVSAWDDLTPAVTITGASVAFPNVPVIFSGDTIRAVALDFVQNPDPVTGRQVVSLGIWPRWIMVASEGTSDLNVPSVSILDHAVGWTDCAQQVGFWTGQDADTQLNPLTGARWMSTDSLLRFGTANAASTTFDAVMEFVSVTSAGLLTVRWPVTDGGSRRVVLFALGEALPPQTVVRLTQLPIEAAYGYPLIQQIQNGTARLWNTPAPTPSRRGR